MKKEFIIGIFLIGLGILGVVYGMLNILIFGMVSGNFIYVVAGALFITFGIIFISPIPKREKNDFN